MSGRCSPSRWAARWAPAPAALQVTFSLLIVLQTFFSPFQGWLVDRFGPRQLIGAGRRADRAVLGARGATRHR